MSRISCDVTRDLLAPYLDGICSEESKGLVEEHLKECAACREFVEQTQGQDLGKDAAEVDFLKRVRRFVDVRLWIAVALSLALVLIGRPGVLYQPLQTLFYYAAMPILMLMGGLMLTVEDGKSGPVKLEWVIPALGAAAFCAVLGLQVMMDGFFDGTLPMPCPENDIGPWLETCCKGIVALSVAELILSLVRLRGRRKLFIVSQNLGLLGMNLALSVNQFLYYMADYSGMKEFFVQNTLILSLEFAVMTTLMLVFYHVKEKR